MQRRGQAGQQEKVTMLTWTDYVNKRSSVHFDLATRLMSLIHRLRWCLHYCLYEDIKNFICMWTRGARTTSTAYLTGASDHEETAMCPFTGTVPMVLTWYFSISCVTMVSHYVFTVLKKLCRFHVEQGVHFPTLILIHETIAETRFHFLFDSFKTNVILPYLTLPQNPLRQKIQYGNIYWYMALWSQLYPKNSMLLHFFEVWAHCSDQMYINTP